MTAEAGNHNPAFPQKQLKLKNIYPLIAACRRKDGSRFFQQTRGARVREKAESHCIADRGGIEWLKQSAATDSARRQGRKADSEAESRACLLGEYKGPLRRRR